MREKGESLMSLAFKLEKAKASPEHGRGSVGSPGPTTRQDRREHPPVGRGGQGGGKGQGKGKEVGDDTLRPDATLLVSQTDFP